MHRTTLPEIYLEPYVGLGSNVCLAVLRLVEVMSSSHVDRCAWFARKLTGSSSPAAMADGGGRAVVRRRPPASICSGEVLYSFVVTYQS